MYCIFHLPRTGSRYLHSLINSSLSYIDPRHIGTHLEPFNPEFNTLDDVERKFELFTNAEPTVTVKMVINHYSWLADRFVNHPKYTTIFIKPKNYRKRLLKALVEKYFKSYSNGTDRKDIREPFVGKLKFSDALIEERFIHYKIHMDYETKCDYVFYDEYVFTNSQDVLTKLNLPYVAPRYKRVAPYYTDEDMLENIEEFNRQYDDISIKTIGYVV